MSRSLTAAARGRYAPQALCVLWDSVGSRTAAERFVEAVAGRWERSCLDLEEQLEARRPSVTWSERSTARRGARRGRSRRKSAGATVESGSVLPDERLDAEDEPARSAPLRPRLERQAAERSARGARELTPRPGRERDPGQRATESGRASPRLAAADEGGGTVAGRPDAAEMLVAPEMRSRPAPIEEGSRAAGSVARPAVTGAPGASPRGRDDGECFDHRRTTRPRQVVGTTGDVAATHAARAAPLAGGPTRPWDAAADTDADFDEPLRRRFEQWSLERRWRDEAYEEWRRWEF